MSLERVEVELEVASANTLRLREELQAAEEWESALRTSADVLRRLAGLPVMERVETFGRTSTPTTAPGQARTPRAVPISRGQRITDAATEILRREGRRIRTAELAELMADLGFDLGHGIPGRVSTDLSNQLSRFGRHLRGTRMYGWGLTEWGDEMAPGPGPNVEEQELSTHSPTTLHAPAEAEEREGRDGEVIENA